MVHLLVTNAYSARNRGDAGIILGMLNGFARTTLRGATVSIASADYPDDCTQYEVPVVPSFFSLQRQLVAGRKLGRLYFLTLLLPATCLWAFACRFSGWRLPPPPGLGGVLRPYQEADLIVAAGGGYLYTTSAVRGNIVLAMQLLTIMLGALLAKPVYLYAQSIGPFRSRFQASLVRRCLNMVQLVEAREAWTRRLLDDWTLRARTADAADGAFLLDSVPAPDVLPPRHASRLRVGVTVRQWFRSQADQGRYERTMADFLDCIVQQERCDIVFLPQVTASALNDDDRDVARRTAQLMEHSNAVQLVEHELAAPRMKWLCGQMDCVVGTRMHSNIFAQCRFSRSGINRRQLPSWSSSASRSSSSGSRACQRSRCCACSDGSSKTGQESPTICSRCFSDRSCVPSTPPSSLQTTSQRGPDGTDSDPRSPGDHLVSQHQRRCGNPQ